MGVLRFILTSMLKVNAGFQLFYFLQHVYVYSCIGVLKGSFVFCVFFVHAVQILLFST